MNIKITFRLNPEDPIHPLMHGDSPLAKEFNKRQAVLWSSGKQIAYDYEQVTTILLEIFADDFNERHSSTKKRNKK